MVNGTNNNSNHFLSCRQFQGTRFMVVNGTNNNTLISFHHISCHFVEQFTQHIPCPHAALTIRSSAKGPALCRLPIQPMFQCNKNKTLPCTLWVLPFGSRRFVVRPDCHSHPWSKVIRTRKDREWVYHVPSSALLPLGLPKELSSLIRSIFYLRKVLPW